MIKLVLDCVNLLINHSSSFLTFVLTFRLLFLDGAFKGIYYLFKPNLNKIFDINVWVAAGKEYLIINYYIQAN